MARTTTAQVATGTTLGATTNNGVTREGKTQVGSTHQAGGTLRDVPMAGEPTEVQETPIGFVETDVVSNNSHDSFVELRDDAQRVTSEGPEIDIDLDFPDDPSDPSYHTGNGNGSPSGSPSDDGGQDPPSDAEERADRLALTLSHAALMKDRERAELKTQLDKLRAQKANGFIDEPDLPEAKLQRMTKSPVVVEKTPRDVVKVKMTSVEADEVHHSAGGGQAPLLDNSKESEKDCLEELRKELEELHEEQERFDRKAKLHRLQALKANEFREESIQPGAKRQRLDKDKLALGRAQDTRRSDLYTGQSQKHLDKFLRQAEATFRTMPTVYATDEDKCIYAGKSLGERPGKNWAAMDKAVKADPERSYSWKAFVEMLQQDLLQQVEPAPAGTTVKKSYNVAQGDSSIKKTTHTKNIQNLLTMSAAGGSSTPLEEASTSLKRKRSSQNGKSAEEALAVSEVAPEIYAHLESDLQVALGKIAELERQALVNQQPDSAVPDAAALALAVPGPFRLARGEVPVPAAVSIGEQTIKDLSSAVSSLARSTRRRSVAAGGLPGLPGAPSWCARCIVKGGWWREKEHECITIEGRKNCSHCASVKRPCHPISKRFWGEARIFIREINHARATGEEALVATAAKGAKFAKKMRALNARSKPSRPNGLVEQKLDRLIALGRITAQLAMHDHGLHMENVDDVLFEDDEGDEEPMVEVSDAE